MMHALEDEPENRGRWGRMGIGLGIALALGTALVIGADHIVPTKRLLAEVLPIEMVDVPEPPPKREEPPPPPPPKELPKPKPKANEPKEPAAAPPPQQAPQPETPAAESVGLDGSSFGSGSGGPAFHTGTSQMGAPGGGPTRLDTPEQELKPAPKLVEARAQPGNLQPGYTNAAQRRGLQGLMVIEVDIDEQGRVKRAIVRGRLDPELDEAARRTVEKWKFAPAMLAGRAVASTKFLRFRFELK